MVVPVRSRGSTLVRAGSSEAARRLVLPAQTFVHTEMIGGVVLLAAAVASLVWANSRWGSSYETLWSIETSIHIGRFTLSHTLRDWINDALMVVFFFVVGLEVKRELVHGQLAEWRRASLPVACALGGMLVPAVLFLLLNSGVASARGWGIPMATDIAFAVSVLALVGDGVPAALRVFLLALATVDDVGAILVIALFYSDHLSLLVLGIALLLIGVLIAMQRLGVQNLLYYFPVAVLFWFAVLQSGVHATIAGVILGLITPTSARVTRHAFLDSGTRTLPALKAAVRSKDEENAEAVLGKMEELTSVTESAADRLVRLLHPWSSYLILPVFALANAGVTLSPEIAYHSMLSPVARGVFLGLVFGKPAGIVLFAWLAVRLRLAHLMSGVGWLHMAGVGLLGGIGFTVSLFISDLAFTETGLVAHAKLGILLASLIAGIAGFVTLSVVGRGNHVPQTTRQSGS